MRRKPSSRAAGDPESLRDTCLQQQHGARDPSPPPFCCSAGSPPQPPRRRAWWMMMTGRDKRPAHDDRIHKKVLQKLTPLPTTYTAQRRPLTQAGRRRDRCGLSHRWQQLHPRSWIRPGVTRRHSTMNTAIAAGCHIPASRSSRPTKPPLLPTRRRPFTARKPRGSTGSGSAHRITYAVQCRASGRAQPGHTKGGHERQRGSEERAQGSGAHVDPAEGGDLRDGADRGDAAGAREHDGLGLWIIQSHREGVSFSRCACDSARNADALMRS